jgi:hypothetical protein
MPRAGGGPRGGRAAAVETAIDRRTAVGGARGEGVSIEAARGIAERAHRAQIDADGEPYIAHVGRVAAGVPLFARPVGWLHDVLECSNVEEAMFVAAGASPDQCMALRLLARDRGERSDERYLEHVREIALEPGIPGRIARAVKRADLLDRVAHRVRGAEEWTPPYSAGLVVLMKLSASTAAARST